MHPLLDRLLAHGPVVTDGAWGTQLQAHGLVTGEFPDGWNLSRPDQVLAVAEAYVAAGSRILLTNTFGANRLRLAEAPALLTRLADINREGVTLSRRAAGTRASVFASMGPTGKILAMGDVAPADLQAAFEEQARALASAAPDAIVVETMADPEEARLAVAAAKSTGLPVVGCMVFDSGKDKDRTMMGTTPEDAASLLEAAGADGIGANCGQGIEGFVPLCRRLHAATPRPIWIKANAGAPRLVDGHPVYDATPEWFASFVPALLEAGASFIGGCCGTTPDFIRSICAKMPPAASGRAG
ncbi:MAG: homocysteine S-methyltransferase family protein [Verrucomicrobia bacterium]|nr:homocysteine S-methyltransferase family protein [Verrucomicrobiota bacterium]